jgi:hypothetical protein
MTKTVLRHYLVTGDIVKQTPVDLVWNNKVGGFELESIYETSDLIFCGHRLIYDDLENNYYWEEFVNDK